MLQLRNINKDFGGRRIFNGIDWHIRPGDRIGLCGENGAGKTTLLKLLAGQVTADGGEVQVGEGTTFGYLPQEVIVAVESEPYRLVPVFCVGGRFFRSMELFNV